MRNKKPYRLPKSLRGNSKFNDLCQQLSNQYEFGAKAVLRSGYRRPNEKNAIHIASALFGCSFFKARPLWLLDEETGNRLELDGYNQQRAIAIEYQSGIHHKICEITIYREKLKRKICKSKGIFLLEIWPEIHTCRLLLQFFEVLGGLKIIPSCPTLWYGCWLNLITDREIFSHQWLTYRGARSLKY